MGGATDKRIGSVPYLNAAPLTCGIESETEFMPPSSLAKCLRAGELAAGLLSLTEALFNDLYDILDGVAVASDGPVKSVFVAHKTPLDQVETIHCDTASLSSVSLLKVILAKRGLSPRIEPFGDYPRAVEHDAVLLIGNPGLDFLRVPHEHKIFDLGQAWKDDTGLPFVYAVWIIRRDRRPAGLGRTLLQAKQDGLAKLDEIIATRSEFDPELRASYLREHIRFDLGEREKQGIARFIEELGNVTGQPVFEPSYIPQF
ncbi:MAG TPA: menaquinone biosynthesis protein [Verrucomicrobiota bacterium]|jgi:predicted solute-binding protein|nr:menaquinone biosynthesis protein [Verrucomicrobiota bacterium]